MNTYSDQIKRVKEDVADETEQIIQSTLATKHRLNVEADKLETNLKMI